MLARVLLTNGTKTVKLYWLEHTGRDVIHGWPGSSEHFTYHGGGEIHRKTEDGRYEDVVVRTPLQSIKRWYAFISVGFINGPGWFDGLAGEKLIFRAHKTRSKADAILMIDCRTIPVGTRVNVGIGLLEPGNLESLNGLLTIEEGRETIIPKQVLIDCSVKPWVWAMVFWWHPNADEQFDALYR